MNETPGLLPDTPVAAAELAGRLERLAAVLIDALMGIIPGVAALAYSGGLEGVLKGQPLTTQQTLLVAGWSWGSFLAINSYLLLKRGQTIGSICCTFALSICKAGSRLSGASSSCATC